MTDVYRPLSSRFPHSDNSSLDRPAPYPENPRTIMMNSSQGQVGGALPSPPPARMTRKRAASLNTAEANNVRMEGMTLSAPTSGVRSGDGVREPICLCTPAPKIPRPRNGMSVSHSPSDSFPSKTWNEFLTRSKALKYHASVTSCAVSC